MAVVIGKEVSLVSAKTDRVKSVTLQVTGTKLDDALKELEFKDGDKIEGKVEIDPRGKIAFNIRVFK